MSFVAGKEIVKAEDLRGPRVYSTDLLPSLLDPKDVPGSVDIAARALKIKIITKGLVTLNSVYLLSPLAVHLLEKHPDLLDGSAILPAFRTDKDSLEDLLPSLGQSGVQIDKKRLDDHIAKIDQVTKRVMPWELKDTADKYKAAVVEGLKNERSLVRNLLATSGVKIQTVGEIATTIQGLDLKNSATLREYIDTLPDPIQSLMNRFTASCYHMVGTGVVKCETGIDLNPLSSLRDYDLLLAEHEQRQPALTDEGIFLEAFLASALDAIGAGALPSQIIDAIDFQTAHQMSQALRTKGFQDKYDSIVSDYLSKARSANPKEALESLDVERIAQTVKELAAEFQSHIDQELSRHKTLTQSEAQAEVVGWFTDTAKDAGNSVPGISNIIAFASMIGRIMDSYKLGKNIPPAISREVAVVKAQQDRIEQIRARIESLDVSGGRRSSLLDAANMFSDIHGIKVRRF